MKKLIGLVLALFLGGCSKMATYSIVPVLADGFASAPSGTAYFYSPGTTVPLVIYGDNAGTAITNPVTLSATGSAVVYLNQLARMLVQTNGGVTVFDSTVNQQIDSTTAVTSTAFPSNSTVKSALDAALVAFGGQSYQYVPSGAWVGMTPKTWMNGVVRNVLAYVVAGATTVNDGVTPADTALAAAIADAQANGASDVYLPPGTYLLNSACTINTTGVTIRGAGPKATVIKINSGSNNGFTTSSANGLVFRNLAITSASGTTGAAISDTSTSGIILDNVTMSSVANGLVLSGSSYVSIVNGSSLTATTDAVSATNVSGLVVIGGLLSGGTASLATSGCNSVSVIGTNAFLITLDSASNEVAVIGCQASFAGSQPISFFQRGNALDGASQTVASGGTATAFSLANGQDFVVIGNGGGAGTITIPDPTFLPPGGAKNYLITVVYKNALGGAAAVTWAFSGSKFVHVGGAVPSGTDGTQVVVQYRWDGITSKFREVCRAQTTT
jgi:hypothetical protein